MRMPWCAAIAVLVSACVEGEGLEVETMEQAAAVVGVPGTTAESAVYPLTEWQYHDGQSDPGPGWRIYDQDAGAPWAWGGGPLGYGESYIRTTIDAGNPTAYFRRPFTVSRTVRKMYLRVMYDDGFVFYLNGKEGGRAHMPSGPIGHTTLAAAHEAQRQYVTFDISDQIPNLRSDVNSLAIEVHQSSLSSSDLVFDAELILFVDGLPGPSHGGVALTDWWSFWDRGGDLGTAWRQTAYDDSQWIGGQAELGYGEPYIRTTTRRGPMVTYFRKDFTVDGPALGLTARILFDDGFIAYLNGTEIARRLGAHEADPAHPLELDWSHAASLIDPDGVNTLAVEVHQASATSSDLVFALGLGVHTTWTPVWSGTSSDLHGVWFMTPTTGFGVGDDGAIIGTQNGGQSWAHGVLPTTADLLGIQFVDELNGWIPASDGTVLRTVNGSASWTIHPTGAQALTGLHFIDTQRGWATSSDDVVYRTTDGGVTWSGVELGTGGSFHDVAFADAQRGWIVGSIPVEGDSWAAIYATTDGGATWTQQWLSGLHFYYLLDVEVVDGAVWATGQTSLSGHGERKLVTRDGGATWIEAPSTSNDSGIYGIDFADALRGWGVGFHGSVVRTDDGGETWRVEQAGTADGVTLQDVHVMPDGRRWAVGAGGMTYRAR